MKKKTKKKKLHMIRALHPFLWQVRPLPPALPSPTPSLGGSLATVNCARALHFYEILAGLYCHLRSLFLFLLTNLRLRSDREAALGLMHGDGGARRRLGATRIDEDSTRGAATNMLQSARLSAHAGVCVCVCGCIQEVRGDYLCVNCLP